MRQIMFLLAVVAMLVLACGQNPVSPNIGQMDFALNSGSVSAQPVQMAAKPIVRSAMTLPKFIRPAELVGPGGVAGDRIYQKSIRAAKMATSYGVVNATVMVLKGKQVFGGPEYFLDFVQDIPNWIGTNFGVDGEVSLSLSKGYYRARLVMYYTNENGQFMGTIGEWSSLPIRSNQVNTVVLTIGQLARVVYNPNPDIPPARPGVNLLFPRGGEIIPQGPRNVRIDWEVENYKLLTSAAINIELVKDGVVLGNRGPFLLYSDRTFWNFSWEVGTYYDINGMQKAPPGNGYRIRVTIYNNDPELSLDKSKTINGGFAESGDFTISIPLPTLPKG